jgi:hypothetical protein
VVQYDEKKRIEAFVCGSVIHTMTGSKTQNKYGHMIGKKNRNIQVYFSVSTI